MSREEGEREGVGGLRGQEGLEDVDPWEVTLSGKGGCWGSFPRGQELIHVAAW